MQPVTHQTVKLSKGRHTSPDDGACVMELASMLAGERFSDHPRCVCTTIAAFLRTYNDLIDDDRRQDLYEYGAKVVGTAAGGDLAERRAEHITQWSQDRLRHRRATILARLSRRLGRTRNEDSPGSIARNAIRAAGRISDETHQALLTLVDELIALDAPDPHDGGPSCYSPLRPSGGDRVGVG